MNCKYLIFILLAASCACSQKTSNSDQATESDPKATHFWLGADISGISGWEKKGIHTYTVDSIETETTALMNQYGIDAARYRVWVNPADSLCNMHDVLQLAQRAKANDMDIMIDFHYSDWWADPGKQITPQAWKDYNLEQMKQAVADHTAQTLQLLSDNDISVRWVQIGNETPNGMLWPMAKLEKGTGPNMAAYAALNKAGYEAAKKVYPEAQMIVHLDNGYDREQYVNMFDSLRSYRSPFDAIGMSVYPYWSKRDQTDSTAVSDIIDNINYLADRYQCPVLITEVGVHIDRPEQGRDFLLRLMDAAINRTDGRCPAIFYWAPETCHGGYALGAFRDDKPTVIMDAFKITSQRLKEKNGK